MGETNSVGDVLELAISREIQAAELFMELAGRMGNPAMQAVFERLAEEELEHKAQLELEMMKEGIVAKTVGKLVDVGEADYARDFDLDPDVDFKEVLTAVIEKERRSFRFYARVAGIVPNEDLHDVLLQLAEEEAKHLARFEREYEKLTAREK